MSYSCWVLNDEDRKRLLNLIPPRFPDVIAHHVTCHFPSNEVPPSAMIEVIAEIVDPEGVQALLVTVDCGLGATSVRDDERYFHLTWSLDRAAGKKPVDSNGVVAAAIERDVVTPLSRPIRIATTPAVQ